MPQSAAGWALSIQAHARAALAWFGVAMSVSETEVSHPAGADVNPGRQALELIMAALAGAALAAGGTAFWRRQSALARACEPDPGQIFSCLGTWPFQLLVGLPVLLGLAALALRVAGLRRALLVVPVGAVLTLLLLQVYEARVAGTPAPPLWLGALLGVAGFALAVPLVGVGSHWAVRVVVALGLIAPLPLLPGWDAAAGREQRRKELARVQVPLWIPEVPGYPLQSAYPVQDSTAFAARLSPHEDPLRDRREIRSVVLPAPPDFAPPDACGPYHWQVTSDLDSGGAPCERLGDNHWRRVDLDNVEHILHRDAVLIVISADARSVPEVDLTNAVAHLRLATADELATAG
ncbi:hypothetical protein AAH979_10635 [Plantactinospora sp. ZYX-F-223]|uniref:hypothetical protein n=1 Tax=Plantactinospora sp. ZYX-F-223 TaxID=3144103 RepID=UPI0031FD9668